MEFPAELRRRLWLYVNFECNQLCDYCVAESRPLTSRPHLDSRAFRHLVDDAVDLGFGEVAVTGGEPLLHSSIFTLLAYATARVDTILLTNAGLLRPQHASAFRALRPDRLTVQVSLDSPAAAVHDRHHGAGTWNRTMRGLDLLLGWGCQVAVRATLLHEHANEFEGLRDLLEARGVDPHRVYAAPVVKVGRAKEGLDPGEAQLGIEPTVTGDGLYPHPLRVAAHDRVADEFLPLGPALALLVSGNSRRTTVPRSGYR